MTEMSRSHFSRTFHSVAGMPLRGYVRELRLKRAHELLVSGKLSLTAVPSGPRRAPSGRATPTRRGE